MARKLYAIVGVRMNNGKVISIVLVRAVAFGAGGTGFDTYYPSFFYSVL